MITLERTTGNAYTRDPDYYGFVGPQREVVLYDWSIRAWRKCKLQPLATPRDRVPPVDPDAHMQPEQLDTECANAGLLKAHAQHRAIAEAREARVLANLVAYLTDHGPQGYDALLVVTEWKHVGRLREHLRAHPDTYVELQTNPVIWGLPGQRYIAPPRVAVVPQVALALRDVLVDHGPLTVRDMIKATGYSDSSIGNELKRRPDWFCIVEDRRGGRIWGVRGIHDQQQEQAA